MAVGLAVAFLIVLVPVADAALDPTDTATGTGALASENGGYNNTADGFFALNLNTVGVHNTAVGALALVDNATGDDNTATGYDALGLNTTGDANTAVGFEALLANQSGFGNTALGLLAGVTASGGNANTTGSANTFVGYSAGPGTDTQLSNATAIGANALVSEDNALVLGAPDVEVGVGTSAPHSLLQVGTPSTSYGEYLQIPMVTTNVAPPARACNGSTHVGRLVLQYDAQKVRTTLWSCSAAGVWTKLAQGG